MKLGCARGLDQSAWAEKQDVLTKSVLSRQGFHIWQRTRSSFAIAASLEKFIERGRRFASCSSGGHSVFLGEICCCLWIWVWDWHVVARCSWERERRGVLGRLNPLLGRQKFAL